MKVLYIAELGSSHAARWIELAVTAGVEAVLFQSTAADTAICDEFAFYSGFIYAPKYTSGPANQRGKYVQSPLFPDASEWERRIKSEGIYLEAYAWHLIHAIETEKPDLIHVLGLCVRFNSSIRVLLSARKKCASFPKIIYSSWGADLDFFPKISPDEIPFIRTFLGIADFHISECQRDIRLAREFGFKGRLLGILPANGGFDVRKYRFLLRAGYARDRILIKGRDVSDGDPVGRAIKILDAIEQSRDVLKNFKIQILQASFGQNVIRRAAEVRSATGLDIEVSGRLSDEKLFESLARSKIFIANTVNDGLPLSLLEALAMDVYPIHSDLESLHDYIRHHENGSLVNPEESNQIASEIKWALAHAKQVESARKKNRKLVARSFDRDVVRPRIRQLYLRAWNVNFGFRIRRWSEQSKMWNSVQSFWQRILARFRRFFR